VRLGNDHPLLELAHQDALFGGVGLVQHLLIEVNFRLVAKLTVPSGGEPHSPYRRRTREVPGH
jgi:hypothetical protein